MVRSIARLVLAGVALAATAACARWSQEVPSGSGTEAPLFENLGDHHHEISTDSALAQRYFDQGLTQVYGFNHAAAVTSFEQALRLDPGCARCWWGIAYALGPNINAPMGPDAARRAYAAVQSALALADGASERDRAYIEALATRYEPEPGKYRQALDLAYADAMRRVASRFPDDLDAATLFAEALMDLSPWNYWSGKEPRENTLEIVRTLEGVLAREPEHLGANHYYIHAMEAPYPEKAEAAADRLASLSPGSGHLVHMPSHIYWRVGRYEDAAEINQRAAAADEVYFGWCRRQGIYAALYYPHNIHFLWASAAAEGRAELALISARKLASEVPDSVVEEFPAAEEYQPYPVLTLVRFGRWDAVLGEPEPAAERLYARAIRHYARALAYTRLGRADEARAEHELLVAIAESAALDQVPFVAGPASDYVVIGRLHLEAEMAASRGEYDLAIAALEDAVRLQDNLPYTEPPPWYFPVRQALGAVLLEAGRAAEAEAVYRRDLEQHPKNGWSLYGLARSLRARGMDPKAELVERGFANAWARADVELEASRF